MPGFASAPGSSNAIALPRCRAAIASGSGLPRSRPGRPAVPMPGRGRTPHRRFAQPRRGLRRTTPSVPLWPVQATSSRAVRLPRPMPSSRRRAACSPPEARLRRWPACDCRPPSTVPRGRRCRPTARDPVAVDQALGEVHRGTERFGHQVDDAELGDRVAQPLGHCLRPSLHVHAVDAGTERRLGGQRGEE